MHRIDNTFVLANESERSALNRLNAGNVCLAYTFKQLHMYKSEANLFITTDS